MKGISGSLRADRRDEAPYFRWKKEYGGLRADKTKRLKELEKENARLKRILEGA